MQQSYLQGVCDRPLLGVTIGEHFDAIANQFAERDALIARHQGIRWSYRELAQQVQQIAAGLLAHGFERGDRIGIWAQNCAEWVLMQLATAKTGLILVNINPAYRAVELEHALQLVGCKGLVLAPSFKSSNYIDLLRQVVPELDRSPKGSLHSSRLPALSHVYSLGGESNAGLFNFDELRAAGSQISAATLAHTQSALQFDDAINIQFTSGTTGAPKGATLTHHNILNTGFFIGEAMGLTECDRLCIPVPLYHCFGMVLGNLACLTHGAAMVYPDAGFDAARVLEAVAAERCTGFARGANHVHCHARSS